MNEYIYIYIHTELMDPRIHQLCNNVTKLINEHKDEQWQNKLNQMGDHNKNSYTLWNTINYLRGKKLRQSQTLSLPSETNQ